MSDAVHSQPPRVCLTRTTSEKQRFREELERDVEAFIAAGGRVDQSPEAYNDPNGRPVGVGRFGPIL